MPSQRSPALEPVSGPDRNLTLSSASAPVSRDRIFLLDVPFFSRNRAVSLGARHDKNLNAWIWSGAALPDALKEYQSQPFSYARFKQDDLNGVKHAPSVPEKDITLREHQAEAVSAILQSKRIGRVGYLLADDVGLGKTITSWKALAMMPDVRTVLIVCPLAVAAHWRRTISWMGDHGKRAVVINYDRLASLFEMPDPTASAAKPKKGTTRSKAGKPASRVKLKTVSNKGKASQFDAIIIDESHKLKNPAAARSKLASKLIGKAKFTLWLSATAGQNPLELAYLSRLLAQMTGDTVSDLTEFEEWCKDKKLGVERGPFGQWIWQGGAEECRRVHTLLFGGAIPAGLRRRPEDIAGWPELQRIPMAIELEPETFALYEELWVEFRKEMGLMSRGKNPRSALAAVLRFRQKASLLRVDGTSDMVRNLVAEGRKVAVSVQFIETLDAIRERLEKGQAALLRHPRRHRRRGAGRGTAAISTRPG